MSATNILIVIFVLMLLGFISYGAYYGKHGGDNESEVFIEAI